MLIPRPSAIRESAGGQGGARDRAARGGVGGSLAPSVGRDARRRAIHDGLPRARRHVRPRHATSERAPRILASPRARSGRSSAFQSRAAPDAVPGGGADPGLADDGPGHQHRGDRAAVDRLRQLGARDAARLHAPRDAEARRARRGRRMSRGWTRDRLADEGAEDFASVWAEAQQWLDDSFPSTSPLVWAAHNGHSYDRPILLRHIAEAAQRCRASRGGSTRSTLRAARSGRSGTARASTRSAGSTPTPPADRSPAHTTPRSTAPLGRVWRWLVEEVDDAPLKFQSYLQREAYPPPAPAPSAAAEPARATTRRPSGSAAAPRGAKGRRGARRRCGARRARAWAR